MKFIEKWRSEILAEMSMAHPICLVQIFKFVIAFEGVFAKIYACFQNFSLFSWLVSVHIQIVLIKIFEVCHSIWWCFGQNVWSFQDF